MSDHETQPRPGRTLVEQWGGTPPELQARLFRVLDIVIGMSQDEKTTARQFLGMALYTPHARDNAPASDLLHALDMLVFIAERLAEPTLGGGGSRRTG